MRALTNALRYHVEGWWRLWFPARDEEPYRVESGPFGRRGLSNLSASGPGGLEVYKRESSCGQVISAWTAWIGTWRVRTLLVPSRPWDTGV